MPIPSLLVLGNFPMKQISTILLSFLLMTCGSLNGIVVEPEALQGWRSPLVLFRMSAFFSLFPLSACRRIATRLLEVYICVKFAICLFATLSSR